jgi:hypothetical protein
VVAPKNDKIIGMSVHHSRRGNSLRKKYQSNYVEAFIPKFWVSPNIIRIWTNYEYMESLSQVFNLPPGKQWMGAKVFYNLYFKQINDGMPAATAQPVFPVEYEYSDPQINSNDIFTMHLALLLENGVTFNFQLRLREFRGYRHDIEC